MVSMSYLISIALLINYFIGSGNEGVIIASSIFALAGSVELAIVNYLKAK